MMASESSNIHWHPAFIEAIKLELSDYRDSLEFFSELPLTAEPLRIDCIVIKKTKGLVITKNIASIFKEFNILEYKSPADYVSVGDFYKVYGYACLYACLHKVPITNLTISFIESRLPKKLFKHLRDIRGYMVEKTSPGIYTVKGDILPIQIINNRQLSVEENLWLKNLTDRLDLKGYLQINTEIARLEETINVGAYLNVLVQANVNILEEAAKMSNAAKSLDEVLERTGIAAKWEAKAEERKALNIARNMVNLGYSMENIISATQLDSEKVKELL